MGRDVPAMIVSQQDRRAYREKVRHCLDVFARMLRESRFDNEPLPGRRGDRAEPRRRRLPARDDKHEGPRRDRRPELGDRTRPVQPGNQRPAPPARRPVARRARDRGRGRAGACRRTSQGHRQPAGHDRHSADGPPARRHRRRDVGEPQVPAAERPDDRRSRRGHADQHRRAGAAADARRHDHAGGLLHERAVSPAGEPGVVLELLECRPGGGRHSGGTGREFPVPIRPGALARNPDPVVRAGDRHPAGGAEAAGRAAAGVVRGALDHVSFRPFRGESAVFPRAPAAARGRGPGGRRWTAARRRSSPSSPCTTAPCTGGTAPSTPWWTGART